MPVLVKPVSHIRIYSVFYICILILYMLTHCIDG